MGVPYFVQSPYATFAQGLEACLLCQALAEQSRGRRGTALAWATAAALAKPSLGLVYGLIVVLLIARDAIRGRWPIRRLLGRDGLGPAIATGAVGLAVLAGVYGIEPVVRHRAADGRAGQLPRREFRLLLRRGPRLLAPARNSPAGYYLGTVAGFWIVGSITLLIAGLVALARWGARGDDPDAATTREAWSRRAVRYCTPSSSR